MRIKTQPSKDYHDNCKGTIKSFKKSFLITIIIKNYCYLDSVYKLPFITIIWVSLPSFGYQQFTFLTKGGSPESHQLCIYYPRLLFSLKLHKQFREAKEAEVKISLHKYVCNLAVATEKWTYMIDRIYNEIIFWDQF